MRQNFESSNDASKAGLSVGEESSIKEYNFLIYISIFTFALEYCKANIEISKGVALDSVAWMPRHRGVLSATQWTRHLERGALHVRE